MSFFVMFSEFEMDLSQLEEVGTFDNQEQLWRAVDYWNTLSENRKNYFRSTFGKAAGILSGYESRRGLDLVESPGLSPIVDVGDIEAELRQKYLTYPTEEGYNSWKDVPISKNLVTTQAGTFSRRWEMFMREDDLKPVFEVWEMFIISQPSPLVAILSIVSCHRDLSRIEGLDYIEQTPKPLLPADIHNCFIEAPGRFNVSFTYRLIVRFSHRIIHDYTHVSEIEKDLRYIVIVDTGDYKSCLTRILKVSGMFNLGGHDPHYSYFDHVFGKFGIKIEREENKDDDTIVTQTHAFVIERSSQIVESTRLEEVTMEQPSAFLSFALAYVVSNGWTSRELDSLFRKYRRFIDERNKRVREEEEAEFRRRAKMYRSEEHANKLRRKIVDETLEANHIIVLEFFDSLDFPGLKHPFITTDNYITNKGRPANGMYIVTNSTRQATAHLYSLFGIGVVLPDFMGNFIAVLRQATEDELIDFSFDEFEDIEWVL